MWLEMDLWAERLLLVAVLALGVRMCADVARLEQEAALNGHITPDR
jgi:hypothetical protein